MKKKVRSDVDFSPILQTEVVSFYLDEDGVSVPRIESVDVFSSIISNGHFQDWSLNSLLSAGISPNFPIHTSGVSRLGFSSDVSSVISEVNSILDGVEDSKFDASNS